jgi:hypothetical protein
MLTAKQEIRGTVDMKVTIKSFEVDMEVKNAGVEFEVYSLTGKRTTAIWS